MPIHCRTLAAVAAGLLLAGPAIAHEVLDLSIKHQAKDGVVRVYGAGGP